MKHCIKTTTTLEDGDSASNTSLLSDSLLLSRLMRRLVRTEETQMQEKLSGCKMQQAKKTFNFKSSGIIRG